MVCPQTMVFNCNAFTDISDHDYVLTYSVPCVSRWWCNAAECQDLWGFKSQSWPTVNHLFTGSRQNPGQHIKHTQTLNMTGQKNLLHLCCCHVLHTAVYLCIKVAQYGLSSSLLLILSIRVFLLDWQSIMSWSHTTKLKVADSRQSCIGAKPLPLPQVHAKCFMSSAHLHHLN